MMTYFPTPYPGEWWYSVLCRYFVRSGYRNFATASKELYGEQEVFHGRLFPGNSCYHVLSNLPAGILDLKAVLLEHTLMPYYLRFYSHERKKKILQNLMRGKTGGITSIDLVGIGGEEGLKYCPLCYQEDIKKYGEPYWHREHQIPLMLLCKKHKIPLIKVAVRYNRLSELYMPLCVIRQANHPLSEEAPWAKPLSQILCDFLEMPFEQGPQFEYSNLHIKLRCMGLGIPKIQKQESLDSKKVYRAIRDFYGEEIMSRYFSKVSRAELYRLCKWILKSPEKYALISVMAGLTAEELFGPPIEHHDPYLSKLLQYREQGTTYRKGELAMQMGLSPARLDSLANKYGIEPFWKQLGSDDCDCKRTESLRIKLTKEEKRQIVLAAEMSGGGQVAVYARTVLLRAAKSLAKKQE